MEESEYIELNRINRQTSKHSSFRDYRRVKRRIEDLLIEKDVDEYIEAQLEGQQSVSLEPEQMKRLKQISRDQYFQEIMDYCRRNEDPTLEEAEKEILGNRAEDKSCREILNEAFNSLKPDLY